MHAPTSMAHSHPSLLQSHMCMARMRRSPTPFISSTNTGASKASPLTLRPPISQPGRSLPLPSHSQSRLSCRFTRRMRQAGRALPQPALVAVHFSASMSPFMSSLSAGMNFWLRCASSRRGLTGEQAEDLSIWRGCQRGQHLPHVQRHGREVLLSTPRPHYSA